MCYLGLLLDYGTREKYNTRKTMQKNKHRKQSKNICSDLITKVHIKCKYLTTYTFITGNEQMAHLVNTLLIYILVFIYMYLEKKRKNTMF